MSPTDPEARRLEVLSPEQHALLGRVRQEWLEVGLATGPADRPAAERGVRLAYQGAGLRPPERVVWLGSPLAGMIAAAMLVVSDLTDHAPDGHWRAVRSQLQEQLQGSLWVQPCLGLPPASQGGAAGRFGTPAGRPVREQMAERVRLAVVGEVSARLGPPAWESLWRVVQSPVLEQVSELTIRLGELLRRVVDPVVAPLLADADEVAAWELPDPRWAVGGARDPDWLARGAVWFPLQLVPETLHARGLDELLQAPGLAPWWWPLDWDLPDPLWAVGGQHEADWLATAAALRQLLPGTLDAPGLDGLLLVARSAGWWWPFEHLVILTERPVALHHDPQGENPHGRLHAADGPALAYPDGFAVWAWHGVAVPRQVVEQPERLTVQQIRDEPNAAVRQVMVERYGPDRYLRHAGSECISHDDTGTLWYAEVGDDDERLVMVEVRNSTPEPDGSHKRYWLRVPPEVGTAREAVAWTFGLSADSYQPVIET